MPEPSHSSFHPTSDDDEHDHLVHTINTKPHATPISTASPHSPPTSTSLSPPPLILQSTSPFPLSSSLPLPPPLATTAPSSTSVDEALERDAQFLLIHKLDRKALALLSSPPG